MFCGEITLWLHQAKLVKIVKEGMKYYDANGVLQEEIPNEDVPVPAQDAVLARVAGGTVFTTVEAQVSQGKGLELGIDIPKEEDPEEVDTYWLCLVYEEEEAGWERYCSPVDE